MVSGPGSFSSSGYWERPRPAGWHLWRPPERGQWSQSSSGDCECRRQCEIWLALQKPFPFSLQSRGFGVSNDAGHFAWVTQIFLCVLGVKKRDLLSCGKDLEVGCD